MDTIHKWNECALWCKIQILWIILYNNLWVNCSLCNNIKRISNRFLLNFNFNPEFYFKFDDLSEFFSLNWGAKPWTNFVTKTNLYHLAFKTCQRNIFLSHKIGVKIRPGGRLLPQIAARATKLTSKKQQK